MSENSQFPVQITQEYLRSLPESERYDLMRCYREWRDRQRKQDRREMQNLKCRIYAFKNPDKIKAYKHKTYIKRRNKNNDIKDT